jgi:hypothetical protein
MTFANVVRLNFFTTDIDEMLKVFGSVNSRIGDKSLRDQRAWRCTIASPGSRHGGSHRG